jgi:hypothetical protein
MDFTIAYYRQIFANMRFCRYLCDHPDCPVAVCPWGVR